MNWCTQPHTPSPVVDPGRHVGRGLNKMSQSLLWRETIPLNATTEGMMAKVIQCISNHCLRPLIILLASGGGSRGTYMTRNVLGSQGKKPLGMRRGSNTVISTYQLEQTWRFVMKYGHGLTM